MTLREHLDNIGRVMTTQGATKVEVLYFQLYLLCLGWDGLLYDTESLKDSNEMEPYKMLGEKTLLNSLWGYAIEQYSHEDIGAFQSFIDDDDINFGTQREDYVEVFNGLLNAAARTSGHGFDHFQPFELSELVYRLSGYQKGMTVYNPFAGVGSYAEVFAVEDLYFGEELDPMIWGIGVLRGYINGYLSLNYICGDSLKRTWTQTFDIVVSTPPLGAITLKEEEYAPQLVVKDAESLLGEFGTMVLVTSGSLLFSARGRTIAECGLLDLVVSLPRNVFYWTSYPPVIVRIKAGRDTSEPIKMIDGTSFYSPGGNHTVVIDTEALYSAYFNADPKYTALVSYNDIVNNGLRLNPALYIDRKEDDAVDGKSLVPLQNLGTIIRPARSKEQPSQVIKGRDLSENPLNLDISPSVREEDDRARYGVLSGKALLIGGTPSQPRLGILNTTVPIGVSSLITAFIPDERIVLPQYIAVVLAEKGVASYGSSLLRITVDDLSLTKIPLVPINEQELIIREYRHKHQPKQQFLPTQRVRVAMIGVPSVPKYAEEGLDIRISFDNANKARTWIQAAGNSRKIDAFVVNQTDGISIQSILLLCGASANIPVFIVSPDLQELEIGFSDCADLYLPGKSFPKGGEPDLFLSLFKLIDAHNSPEGRIREVFATELEAAANLDGKFCFKDANREAFILRDKLEEMLLNRGSGKDYRNVLRTIRDNCLIEPLSGYGYLPQMRTGIFDYGAIVNFMADRYYKNEQGCQFLIKSVIPKNLATLLVASKPILNEGSHDLSPHTLSPIDQGLQLIALQVIMAFICHMSNLVSQGLFDRMDTEQTGKECLGSMSDFKFESGQYIVKSLKDEKNYLYANNVHLPREKSRFIRPGDIVYINDVSEERYPRITDNVKIVFVATSFEKVQ